MIKRVLLLSALSFSISTKAIDLQPKFVVGVGGFVSSDKSISENIGKQSISHFRDLYVGLSFFNRIAVYTNETKFNKGYNITYNFSGKDLNIKTQTYTTGVLVEPFQKSFENHEFALGLSINKNRRYLNNDVATKLSYTSTCAEVLYNYLKVDSGLRLAYCPNEWTSKTKENIDLVYFTIYKRF